MRMRRNHQRQSKIFPRPLFFLLLTTVGLLLLLSINADARPGARRPTRRPARGATAGTHVAKPPSKALAEDKWVRETLARLSLREKIGQMIMTSFTGKQSSNRGRNLREIKKEIAVNKVGGLIMFRGRVHETVALTNRMQRMAKIPLLLASDFEHGVGTQVAQAASFPSNMAIGATGSEEYAYDQGKITALEGRALGIHWTYAPVADVNSNPDNPIINTRAYGEDPKQVSRFVTAFVRGAQENGMMATAKHFPGHGDTSEDSHSQLVTISADRQRMEQIELAPFAATIASGVQSIMAGHIAVPKLTGDPNLPATLSHEIITDLLRRDLGFKGLVVTDSLEMGAVTNRFGPGEAAVKAVEAGVDVLLMPPAPSAAIEAILQAVATGKISEPRINESVERILRAKARLGLHRNRYVDVKRADKILSDASHRAKAQEIAERAVTAVKNDDGLLPLDHGKTKRILSVIVSESKDLDVGSLFQQEMKKRSALVTTATIGRSSRPSAIEDVVQRAAHADLIVCAPFVRFRPKKGTIDASERQATVIERLLQTGKPVLVVAFGSPYLIRQFPQIKNYLLTYDLADVSQRAAARAIFGEIDIQGKLPVSLAESFPAGHGLLIEARGKRQAARN
jgi:beta-N-acetylhexosaminidase